MRSDSARIPAMSDQDPVITYSRISPDGERTEPRFAAPPYTARRLGGPEDLAEITSPPLFDDMPAEPPFGDDALPRAEFRQMGRARAPRLVAIAGVFAVLTGAGVLAATFGGVVRLDTPARIDASAGLAADHAQPNPATANQAVRVVALPNRQGDANAALIGGTVDVGFDTGVAPGRLITDPPLPRLRPATASANPPQPAAPADVATDANTGADPNAAPDMNSGAEINAAATVNAGAEANVGADVDGVLASVDRVIAEERARAASMATPDAALPAGAGIIGSTGPSLIGPTAVAPPAASGPLPYPVLEPLPAGDPNARITVALNGRPLLRPGRRALFQRRVYVVPVGPVPPADIPNAPAAY